jgi:ADP-ribosyl-[dinitrogen reductase] hydrolase
MVQAQVDTNQSSEAEACFKGLLLGVAVGDSLGLPAEGLSRRRAEKFFAGKWHQRLWFGRGMVSDDTEHTALVGLCLLQHPDSVSGFRHLFAWKLRIWFLSLPAGIGYATLRSILKLWLGISPERSGVYSAGNGPAMRAAVIGAFFAHSPEHLADYIKASTVLTHSDPRALTGASAIAQLAAWRVRHSTLLQLKAPEVMAILASCGRADDSEWREIIDRLGAAFEQRLGVAEFARQMNAGDGISGYIYHTVPMAVYSWMRHFGDFEQSLIAVLNCGGDTDTVAAITGSLAGIGAGEKSIPQVWLNQIHDYPFGVQALKNLATRLAACQQGKSGEPLKAAFFPFLVMRNLFFLLVILCHSFRRLAPPY